MKKIFVTRKLLKENEIKLKNIFDAKLNPDDKIYSAEEIIAMSNDCDGILSSVTDPINSDTILKLSKNIKIIANGAVGFGNIDFKAARSKGIAVTNTPPIDSNPLYSFVGILVNKNIVMQSILHLIVMG